MVQGAYEIAPWCLLLAAAITDLSKGKIYNLLTLPFMAAGFLFAFLLGGISGVTSSLSAVGLALLFFFPLYLIHAVAAGDVKLLMALGAWTVPRIIFHVAALSIIIGAIVGGFLLLKSKGLKDSSQSMVDHLNSAEGKKSFRMPFAPAFLCAFSFVKIAEMRGWSLF